MSDLIPTLVLVVLIIALVAVIWFAERRRRVGPPRGAADPDEREKQFSPEIWRGQGRG